MAEIIVKQEHIEAIEQVSHLWRLFAHHSTYERRRTRTGAC